MASYNPNLGLARSSPKPRRSREESHQAKAKVAFAFCPHFLRRKRLRVSPLFESGDESSLSVAKREKAVPFRRSFSIRVAATPACKVVRPR